MPELHQLCHLVSIADAGTLSRAAEIEHVSQPALTRSIQRLELEWGTTLFDRTKNKIVLNQTGELAVQYARRVLEDVAHMTQAVQALARSQRTICVGSCAPGPLAELLYGLTKRFSGMTLSSETVSPELLEPGLLADTYQLVITDHPIERDGVVCKEYCKESLFLTVPPEHPLAKRTGGVWARELAGETMLHLRGIGIWSRFLNEKMPLTDFIVQDQSDALDALLRVSPLPGFATNLSVERRNRRQNRVVIPFLDAEATITFYCSVLRAHEAYLP